MRALLATVAMLWNYALSAEPGTFCVKSAIDYISHIANAPLGDRGRPITLDDLMVISRDSEIGGGVPRAYERYVFTRKISYETYYLKLIARDDGGVCPLVEYSVVKK